MTDIEGLEPLPTDPCMLTHALVRTPSASIVDGLRAAGGESPDHDRTLLQHGLYVEALRGAGLHVTVLPALEPFPDSTFVEDPAFVFGDTAVLLRSGAPSRLGETEAMADDLRRHFATVVELPGAGHVDGGDLLLLGGAVLIGLSERTDPAGAEALTQVLATVPGWATTTPVARAPQAAPMTKVALWLRSQMAYLLR